VNDDRNCDCSAFFNALNGALMLFALIVHPVLSIIVMIEWAVVAAWLDRPRQGPAPALGAAQLAREAELAAARDARDAERGKEHRTAAVAFPAIVAAVIAAEVIAIMIGRFSHLDPHDVFPWVISGSILAFVVVWAKFWRRPGQQDVAP
jgi:hypothetical protein